MMIARTCLTLAGLLLGVGCTLAERPPLPTPSAEQISAPCTPTIAHMTPPEFVRNHVLGGIRLASPPPEPTTWPAVHIWAAGKNYYGNALLWLDLPDDGIVQGRSESFTEYQFGGTGPPVVTARRIDGAAPSPRIDKDPNPGGGPRDRAATIDFPTPGCWEIRYTIDGTVLQFVVLVR